MFLARKISRAKWEAKEELSEGEISADAVTVDLHTKGNTLSFWRCGGGREVEVEEAALAIAAAGQRVDKIDIVWVDENELKTDGQTLEDTPGRTHVTELINRHVDVCRLDYVRLGNVAHRVLAAIEEDRWTRLSKGRITEILVAAVEQGRVNLDDLQQGVQKQVNRSLQAEQ